MSSSWATLRIKWRSNRTVSDMAATMSVTPIVAAATAMIRKRRELRSSAILAFQHIALASPGRDPLRTDFPPEPRNKNLQRIAVRLARRVVDMFQDLALRYHAAAMVGEVAEQAKLER